MVAPNPATDFTNVMFTSENTNRYTISLTDMQGKLLVVREGVAVNGKNIVRIDLHNYPGGMYFVTLIDSGGERNMVKLVKE